MALTPSTMLPLGTKAPEFHLPDTDGNIVSLDDFAGSRAYLVMFICNHWKPQTQNTHRHGQLTLTRMWRG